MQTRVTVAPISAPLAQRSDAGKPRKVTGRLKQALDLMAWEGLTDNEAAVQSNITVTAIRLALHRPHVRAYYRAQLDVLRQRESAANIHTLIDVRDQKSNQMARVQAVKALEQLEDVQQSAAARHQAPGFIIQVINAPGALSTQQRDITAKPLIEHASGSDEPLGTPLPREC